MVSRGLKPASLLAASRDHGDRLRYLGGCRCDLCRRANTDYERGRAKARLDGDWNGIVRADKARDHMTWLSRHGVGRHAIASATDIADSILWSIIKGSRANIRARTERKILAVTLDAAADHALVPAGPVWRLIDQLLDAGFSKSRIAAELGRKTHALQLGKKTMTVRNAYDVRRVHARLINSDETLVSAKPTWILIAKLRDEGFSDKHLARELSLDGGGLAISRTRISRGLARRVAELYERAMS